MHELVLPKGSNPSEGATLFAIWRADGAGTPIVLRDIQGLSLEEVAGVLKVPIGTIKSRSNRARLELARVLARGAFVQELPRLIAAAAVYWIGDESRPISGSVVEMAQFPVIGRNPPKVIR